MPRMNQAKFLEWYEGWKKAHPLHWEAIQKANMRGDFHSIAQDAYEAGFEAGGKAGNQCATSSS